MARGTELEPSSGESRLLTSSVLTKSLMASTGAVLPSAFQLYNTWPPIYKGLNSWTSKHRFNAGRLRIDHAFTSTQKTHRSKQLIASVSPQETPILSTFGAIKKYDNNKQPAYYPAKHCNMKEACSESPLRIPCPLGTLHHVP